jgi:(4S)-4-hydroxy-5-phosphonooxypentane-2,3-dione isomerase
VNKFVLLVEFQVKPEELGRFMELVSANAQSSVSDEPGCFQFDVMQTMEDPNRVVLYEVYASEQAFKDHMGMGHTQSFLAAAKPLVTGQKALRMTRVAAPPVKQG